MHHAGSATLFAVLTAFAAQVSAGPIQAVRSHQHTASPASHAFAAAPVNTAASQVRWNGEDQQQFPEWPALSERAVDGDDALPPAPQPTAAPLDRRDQPYYARCDWQADGACTQSLYNAVGPFTAKRQFGRIASIECQDGPGFPVDVVIRTAWAQDPRPGSDGTLTYPEQQYLTLIHQKDQYRGSPNWDSDALALNEGVYILINVPQDGYYRSMVIQAQQNMYDNKNPDTKTLIDQNGLVRPFYQFQRSDGATTIYDGFCNCPRNPDTGRCLATTASSSAPSTSTTSTTSSTTDSSTSSSSTTSSTDSSTSSSSTTSSSTTSSSSQPSSTSSSTTSSSTRSSSSPSSTRSSTTSSTKPSVQPTKKPDVSFCFPNALKKRGVKPQTQDQLTKTIQQATGASASTSRTSAASLAGRVQNIRDGQYVQERVVIKFLWWTIASFDVRLYRKSNTVCLEIFRA